MQDAATTAQGQFGFASPERVKGILESSGWTSIEIRPVNIACSLPVAQLPVYATRMGPYGRVRGTLDQAARAAGREYQGSGCVGSLRRRRASALYIGFLARGGSGVTKVVGKQPFSAQLPCSGQNDCVYRLR